MTTITIKYSLEGNGVKYKNFIEIQQLPNYDSIVYINCSNNNLTSLPSNLPGSVRELECSYNNLTSLPSNLPESLQKLWCSGNNLTELPSNLPESLQELDCSNNKLTSLPSKLPGALIYLYSYVNNLTSLPSNLPGSLQELECSNNKITSLPINLHELRNLTYCFYNNNEIEYIPPQTTRFLNRLKNPGLTQPKLYNDRQNVHDHQIQESIRNSIYGVIKEKPSITIEAVNEEIVSNTVLTEVTKRLLLEYCGDDSIHGVMGITFKELLLAVWSIIREHKDGNEIIGIMNTEMADADCKCFTGKMSRLINCLNGYDDRVSITMAENDQIGNIIIIEKEKMLEGYDIETHKSNVRLAMEERGYTKETIEEWIGYIE